MNVCPPLESTGSVRCFDAPLGEERVYVLRVRFNFCFLVINRRSCQAIAVDPAWDRPLIERVLALEGASLASVVVTHSHPDHVHLAEELSNAHDCPVYMSREEVDFYGAPARNIRPVRHGQSIETAGLSVLPLLTPGHTCGSVCFWVGGNLFSGDTLFVEGCGLCLGPGADPHAMFSSLTMLRATLSGDVRIFPGHSYGKLPGARFSELLENNIYLQFRDVRSFVDFRMRKGQRGLFDFK